MEALEAFHRRGRQCPGLAAVEQNRLDDGFVKHPTDPGRQILPTQKDREPLPDPAGLSEVMTDRLHIIIVHRQEATEILENIHLLKGLAVCRELHFQRTSILSRVGVLSLPFRPVLQNADC